MSEIIRKIYLKRFENKTRLEILNSGLGLAELEYLIKNKYLVEDSKTRKYKIR